MKRYLLNGIILSFLFSVFHQVVHAEPSTEKISGNCQFYTVLKSKEFPKGKEYNIGSGFVTAKSNNIIGKHFITPNDSDLKKSIYTIVVRERILLDLVVLKCAAINK
jgi:hypothetical protein